MARSSTSFSRSKPHLKPQPKVLVICEDSKSGKRYLEDASHHFRVHVDVDIVHCGKTDPKGIVSEAIRRQNKFDTVYCAIDRDTHTNFDEALCLAKTYKKIKLIISYPCFEFWLLLHFMECRKPYIAMTGKNAKSAADLLIKDLKMHPGMSDYDKGKDKSIFKCLLENNRLNDARQRSPRILADAEITGEMNPSTSLHKLIDAFESLSIPQKK